MYFCRDVSEDLRMVVEKYNKGWKFPRNNREKSVVDYSVEVT